MKVLQSVIKMRTIALSLQTIWQFLKRKTNLKTPNWYYVYPQRKKRQKTGPLLTPRTRYLITDSSLNLFRTDNKEVDSKDIKKGKKHQWVNVHIIWKTVTGYKGQTSKNKEKQ